MPVVDASTISPVAARLMPVTTTALTPTRAISCWESTAPIMIPADTGRNASPARSGP